MAERKRGWGKRLATIGGAALLGYGAMKAPRARDAFLDLPSRIRTFKGVKSSAGAVRRVRRLKAASERSSLVRMLRREGRGAYRSAPSGQVLKGSRRFDVGRDPLWRTRHYMRSSR
jgi:hypothetical protein